MSRGQEQGERQEVKTCGTENRELETTSRAWDMQTGGAGADPEGVQ